jgi:hypothetical protein
MAFTEKRLAGPAVLPLNSESTVYTCPASPTTSTIIKQIVICNTSASLAAFSLSLVPFAGATPSTGNRLFSGLSVAANETIFLDVSQVMTSGDYISCLSSISGVTVTISGVENAGGMVISGLADNAVTTAKIADSNITASKLGPDAFLSNNQAGAIILMEMM